MPAYGSALGGGCQTGEIRHFGFDSTAQAERCESKVAGDDRPDSVLSGLAAVDFTEIFDARLEHRMDEQPRLPGRLDRRLAAGVVSGRFLDQQVCPVQHPEFADPAKLGFHERPEGELSGRLVTALARVLDLNKQAEIGEILSLRG